MHWVPASLGFHSAEFTSEITCGGLCTALTSCRYRDIIPFAHGDPYHRLHRLRSIQSMPIPAYWYLIPTYSPSAQPEQRLVLTPRPSPHSSLPPYMSEYVVHIFTSLTSRVTRGYTQVYAERSLPLSNQRMNQSDSTAEHDWFLYKGIVAITSEVRRRDSLTLVIHNRVWRRPVLAFGKY